jgi:hypothetical protein
MQVWKSQNILFDKNYLNFPGLNEIEIFSPGPSSFIKKIIEILFIVDLF